MLWTSRHEIWRRLAEAGLKTLRPSLRWRSAYAWYPGSLVFQVGCDLTAASLHAPASHSDRCLQERSAAATTSPLLFQQFSFQSLRIPVRERYYLMCHFGGRGKRHEDLFQVERPPARVRRADVQELDGAPGLVGLWWRVPLADLPGVNARANRINTRDA